MGFVGFFQKIKQQISYIFLSGFFVFIGFYLYSLEANSQKPQASEVAEDLVMRNYMLDISKQLGVTCNYCHDVKNYKDASKREHQISKQHMRIVHMLNTEGFVGQSNIKVDCFMCHQGRPKFKYRMEK